MAYMQALSGQVAYESDAHAIDFSGLRSFRPSVNGFMPGHGVEPAGDDKPEDDPKTIEEEEAEETAAEGAAEGPAAEEQPAEQ